MSEHHEMQYNILEDALLNVTAGNKNSFLTLPEILASLSRERPVIISFEGLMPHQKQPWYSFLVQLSAIACFHGDLKEPPTDEMKWKELLKNLTREWPDNEPWHIFVEDLSKPAFFQPPVPERTIKNFGAITAPDSDSTTDLLVLSKNHDVKRGRIHEPSIESWIYSLITVQTMGGYPGKGYNQISRMNGGYGNRSLVSVNPGIRWNERFINDSRALINNRDEIKYGNGLNGDIALLWLYDWDGESGFSFNELEPYYIEICRRIRFTLTDGHLIMKKKSTKNCRISGAKQQHGNVGDPWIPVRKGKDSKALTIGRSGYRYDKLCDILFSGNYSRNLCLTFHDDKRNVLLCSALTRGQGKTEGFHERALPIPKSITNILAQRTDLIAQISKTWINDTNTVRQRLKSALLLLLQGAPQNINWKDNRTDKWLREFTGKVDRAFFRKLWQVLEEKEASDGTDDSEIFQDAQSIWRESLTDIAEDIFEKAKKATPLSTALKYRAISKSANLLKGFVHSFLKETCDENQTNRGKTESISE